MYLNVQTEIIVEIAVGKKESGNLIILNKVILVKATFGVNLSPPFRYIKQPKDRVVTKIGEQIQKKLLQIDIILIFLIYSNSLFRIFPTISSKDNSHP